MRVIGSRIRLQARAHSLRINVFQQGHDFVAIVELPDVDRTDLELQAKESTIRISGKKSIDYGDKVSVHRRERVAGTFDRTITVPVQIDPERH